LPCATSGIRGWDSYSFFDDPVYNRRLDAAARLSGPARYAAYADLDRDLAGRESPIIAFAIPVQGAFFSARIGCQVVQSWGGWIDLATLCLKHGGRASEPRHAAREDPPARPSRRPLGADDLDPEPAMRMPVHKEPHPIADDHRCRPGTAKDGDRARRARPTPRSDSPR
jgi:hypothetical protein